MSSPATQSRVRICVCTPGENHAPLIAALLKQMQAQQAVDYDRVEKPSDIPGVMEKSAQGVVIITLFEKEGLLGILNCISKFEDRVRNGSFRIMVISNLDHPKVNSVLRSKGISDILELQMSIKAFNLRLKNALTLVHQANQRLLKGEKPQSTISGGMNASRGRAENSNEIIWDTAVEHACDFWTLPNKKNARFVMDRWLIDIFGPGPAAGTWEQSSFQMKGEFGWEWRPRISTDPTFQRESGSWVFFGKIPEFVWTKNSWALVSKHPKLAFYRDGDVQYERIYIDEAGGGRLHILENSEVSSTYQAQILDSLQSSVKLSQEQNSSGKKRRTPLIRSDFSAQLNPEFLNRRADVSALTCMKLDESNADAAWNDHLGARGVDIGIRNNAIPTEAHTPGWGDGNLLTPTDLGLELGFNDLNAVGIKIDRTAFESIKLSLRLKAKNENLLLNEEPLQLLDVSETTGFFDVRENTAIEGDHLKIEASIISRDRKTQVDIQGLALKVDQLENRRNILTVAFEKESADLLAAVVQLFEDRQVELERFFKMAKGA